MITREADYAIRTLMFLAKQEDPDAFVSTKKLSEEMDIPYRFLRKIVKRLVEKNYILSKKGGGGGVCLAQPSQTISLLDAINAIDPTCIRLNICMVDKGRCGRSTKCSVHQQLQMVQETLDAQLKFITLDKLL